MLSYDDLTAPERELWDAFPTGRLVDLSGGEPPEAALGDGVWGPERTVRAEVVAALMLGANPAPPGALAALRLQGALVSGRLDLSAGEVRELLWFRGCRFVGESIDLHGATLSSIQMQQCRMPRLELHLARIEGDVNLFGSRLDGQLCLNNARIEGRLFLAQMRITTDEPWAVPAGGLEVGGAVLAREGLVVRGGLRFAGTRLNGGLFLEGSEITAPQGVALSAENAIAPVMELTNGFTAAGVLDLSGVQVTDRLSLEGADLGEADEVTCHRMRGGDLIFTPAVPPARSADLRSAKVATLHDERHSWPAEVRLGGLQYEALHRVGPEMAGVASRIAWLRRSRGGYSPQPYEQLAARYRSLGHDHNARRVLLAKQRDRRRTLHPAAQLWGYLLDGTVGYGYRPWLAGLWLSAIAAAATVVFALGDRMQVKPDDDPGFHPLIYTLDLLVPIGGFGMRDEWRWTDGGVQGLAYALVAIGWILTTAVVAGVSRTLNRT